MGNWKDFARAESFGLADCISERIDLTAVEAIVLEILEQEELL